MIDPFPTEMMLGQAAQLAVHQGQQDLQRILVTALPFQQ
jgi:hypothetical protein